MVDDAPSHCLCTRVSASLGKLFHDLIKTVAPNCAFVLTVYNTDCADPTPVTITNMDAASSYKLSLIATAELLDQSEADHNTDTHQQESAPNGSPTH
jgi:hypothetical protein